MACLYLFLVFHYGQAGTCTRIVNHSVDIEKTRSFDHPSPEYNRLFKHQITKPFALASWVSYGLGVLEFIEFRVQSSEVRGQRSEVRK